MLQPQNSANKGHDFPPSLLLPTHACACTHTNTHPFIQRKGEEFSASDICMGQVYLLFPSEMDAVEFFFLFVKLYTECLNILLKQYPNNNENYICTNHYLCANLYMYTVRTSVQPPCKLWISVFHILKSVNYQKLNFFFIFAIQYLQLF